MCVRVHLNILELLLLLSRSLSLSPRSPIRIPMMYTRDTYDTYILYALHVYIILLCLFFSLALCWFGWMKFVPHFIRLYEHDALTICPDQL